LRKNSDRTLLPNVHKINVIIDITEDTEERFPTNEKIRILTEIENDIITKYYDDKVSRHIGIEKTLEQL
jgi:protein tyrosine/serine phosphatase